MSINRRILKIIEHCCATADESKKLKMLLEDNYLMFLQPVSIEKLKEINLMSILDQEESLNNSADTIKKIMESIHRAEAVSVPLDNFF